MEINKTFIIAFKAAIQAGNAIMKIYNDPNSDFGIERKADNSPLTIADKKSNDIITDFLKETPYPILSEEGKVIPFEERSKWNTLWIIDPLDGTKEFIKKNGEFTVNIALVENHIPVMGFVYAPAMNKLYFGEKHIGSYVIDINDDDFESVEDILSKAKKLPLENTDKNNVYKIVASRSHCNEDTLNFIETVKKENGDVELVSIGSSLKICIVAEGNADIYPRFAPTMEWDTAAGQAVALYAGKEVVMSDMTTPITYNKENLLNLLFIVK